VFAEEVTQKSDGALKGMIVVFVASIFIFIALYWNITRMMLRMTTQMEEIVALVFMLPPEVTKKQPVIKRCIESGGASFLEEENA
jgi:hypothetical protein